MERLQKMMESKEAVVLFGKCQRSLGHALPLSSLLLKPVQRILRYKLLLEVSCIVTACWLWPSGIFWGDQNGCNIHKTIDMIEVHGYNFKCQN